VFVYYGNGGRGVALNPRQLQYDTEPLALLGVTHSDSPTRFKVIVLQKTPFGRGSISIQLEAKQVGVGFNSRGSVKSFFMNGTHGQPRSLTLYQLELGARYHWRARVLFDSATTPFMPASRWFTMPWNGNSETDFRTVGFRFYTPLVLRAPIPLP
jgi:hypothetical protein